VPVQNRRFPGRFVIMSPRWPIILSLAVAAFGVANAANPDAGKAAYAPCVEAILP
jgi:hypothetical protein